MGKHREKRGWRKSMLLIRMRGITLIAILSGQLTVIHNAARGEMAPWDSSSSSCFTQRWKSAAAIYYKLDTLPCNKMNCFPFIYTCGTSAINHTDRTWTWIWRKINKICFVNFVYSWENWCITNEYIPSRFALLSQLWKTNIACSNFMLLSVISRIFN